MGISELPDCLLIEIISRLPTTKEAIRTGILSKRWQHLWPYVHNLSFTNDYYTYRKRDAFYSFVGETLAQCRNLNLNRFELCLPFDGRSWVEPTRIIRLIRYAITHNVQDLDLTLIYKEVEFDESFFINPSFRRLRLSYCKLNPTGQISWPNLKSLYVSNAYVDEGLIQDILSGAPLLETLVLDWCHGFWRIDITSRSVKKFMLSGYCGDEDVIEINAPYLVSLTIRDIVFMSEILLLNVTSLLKAELYYGKGPHTQPKRKLRVEEEEILEGLLLNLSHVKELKIGRSCKKALSRLEAKGFTLPKDMKYPDYVYLPFWKCL